MKLDLYTKAVLTVIAACLVWICLRDAALVRPAQAAGIQSNSVRIDSIAPGVVMNVRVEK
jgi:hypothetical protein